MAVTKLPDGRWMVYYKQKGEDGKIRQKKEYFGRGAGAAAQAKKRNQSMKFKKGRPEETDPGPLVGDLVAAYMHAKTFPPKGLTNLKSCFKANLLPAFGDRPAMNLTDMDLDQYCQKRRKDPVLCQITGRVLRIGIKESTIGRELKNLKTVFSWATKSTPKLITANPIRDYKLPNPDTEIIPPLTKDEVRAIMDNAPDHLIRFIKICLYTGARPGPVEILSLNWFDVNFEANIIVIHSARKGGIAARYVSIHEKLHTDLLVWNKQDNNSGPIIHFRGKAIGHINGTWRNTLTRAGITRHLRPYDFRHLFVTDLLSQGADIGAVSQITGSSPETLRRTYQHVTKQVHRDTVALISGV